MPSFCLRGEFLAFYGTLSRQERLWGGRCVPNYTQETEGRKSTVSNWRAPVSLVQSWRAPEGSLCILGYEGEQVQATGSGELHLLGILRGQEGCAGVKLFRLWNPGLMSPSLLRLDKNCLESSFQVHCLAVTSTQPQLPHQLMSIGKTRIRVPATLSPLCDLRFHWHRHLRE